MPTTASPVPDDPVGVTVAAALPRSLGRGRGRGDRHVGRDGTADRWRRWTAVVAVDRAPGFWVVDFDPELTPTPVASPDEAGVGSYEVHPVDGPR